MILSFHPRIRGDINQRLPHKALLTDEWVQMAASAKAIILTQHVKADQYEQLASLGSPIFPDYTHRFGFEGKVGNTKLFRQFHAPHPPTHVYSSVADFRKRHLENSEPFFDFPFVLKGDRGGGGWAVFRAENRAALNDHLQILGNTRLHPGRRFVTQSYVHHGGRDLRVVVLGGKTVAYWRCQKKPGEFRNNVGRGAFIDYDADPELIEKGIGCVKDFCRKTGINLAAFDVLFDRSKPEPLLSEINFLFGRKGLGGSPRFHVLLNEAVQEWLDTI